MRVILGFLNDNAGILTLLFTAVVAISTVFYARLTARLVSETRSLRQAQTDPNVSLYMDHSPELFHIAYLVVRNDGPGAARHVTFNVRYDPDRTVDTDTEKILSELGIIQNGIEYLAPGQELRTSFANFLCGDKTKLDTAFDVDIGYETPSGRSKTGHCRVDFSCLKGFEQIGTPPLAEIAKRLRRIDEDFHRLALGSGFIRVDQRLRHSTDDSDEHTD